MIPCSSLLTRTFPAAIVALLAAAAPAAAHTAIDSPNGGESLTPGQSFQIEWHITITHTFDNWDLEYSTTGENGPWIPIATDLPTGSSTPFVAHYYDWTVPNISSTNVRVRVFMDAGGGGGWEDISDADFTVSDCSAVNYCTSSPNSNGPGAVMGWAGSSSVSANDLTLNVTGAAVSQFGLLFYGPNQISTPFGDGFRCVGGGIYRLSQAAMTDASGDYSRPVDVTQPPADSGGGMIDSGSTWNFQFWYRDPLAGGAGFNLSDGLSITFCD